MAIVHTSLGDIQGVQRTNGSVCWGIPYAKAPVGDLLFRAPVPADKWKNVLDATYGRSNCVQEDSPFSSTHQSRDCLYLNVYVPEHSADETLPVVVWYHGGSWATGGTGADTDSTVRYDMGVFAERVRAIVVTVNYRLNVFGYLYLSHLDPTYQANCGLCDQLLALEWVNQHIAAFGGDNQHITLMGQSAGAGSVMAIMAIPKANPLYERVILMSPPPTSFLTRDEAIQRTRKYLRLVDWEDLSDDQIRKANKKFMKQIIVSGDYRCAFSPVVDGDLLTDLPMRSALQCRKPMIIGYVSHETELFATMLPKALLPLGKTMFPKLTRNMFFTPIDSFYAAYHGPKQKYLYTYTTPEMDSLGLHCCHSFEMPVIFGWNTPLCNPTDARTQQVADSVCQKWKMFIYGEKISGE